MSHKLYDALSTWWPLMSAPEEYEEEASLYWDALASRAPRPIETMLELGSGGGNNASHLRAHARLTLVDPAPGMLAVSRALNPGCEHVLGDMRDVRLGRVFDAVFVHDAICYMTSEADVRRALETAFVHTRPGGVALFAPDYVRETFEAGTEEGGGDDPASGRGMRYLAWVSDPDPAGTTYTVDYAYLLREASGEVRVVHDRHVEGLFAREAWLRWIGEAGFEGEWVPIGHSEVEREYGVFVGRRP